MEKISIREFSRRIGVSDTAVHKAIKSLRIVEGYDPKKKKIDYEIALREWKSNTDPNKQRDYSGAYSRQQKKPKQAGESDPTNLPGDETSENLDVLPSSNLRSKAAVPDADYNMAKKADMVFRAKIRELEYREKQGKLVDKDAVYRELFNAGKELRVALLAVPDRVIDNLMACSSRNEAHSMLYKSLSEILEQLSDIETRKFISL